MHNSEIKLQRLIRLFPVAVVLSGCAIGGPRFATPLKMYQGAEKPTTELVSLMVEEALLHKSGVGWADVYAQRLERWLC